MNRKLLFDNEKDYQVMRLKEIISSFIKYDKERKKYYSKAIQRLGELESFIEEIEDAEDDVKKLECKIWKQRETLNILNNKIEILKRGKDIPTHYEYLSDIMAVNEYLRKQNDGLNKSLDVVRNQNNEYYEYLKSNNLLDDFLNRDVLTNK